MGEKDHLEEFLMICKDVWEQMLRDGTWPWETDSTNPQDMVDSDRNSEKL